MATGTLRSYMILQNPSPFESVQNSVPQEIHRDEVVLPSRLGHKDGRLLTLSLSLALSLSFPYSFDLSQAICP